MRSLGVVLAVLVSGCCWDPSPAAAQPAAVPPKLTALEMELAAMTPEDDARQERLISVAQQLKYIGPVTWQKNTARTELGGAFASLPFKEKESLAVTIAIRGMRKAQTNYFTLVFYDPLTGKRVGSYSTMYGGLQLR